uniref:thioredoxin-dependent peroxiredoxin n=1 Tax=Oryzias sinensis TaxID=183150 RepID=A0A8C8DID3_9TELE
MFLTCKRINTPRKQGGLGSMKIPLVADLTKSISRDYGVLKEDDGIAYRGLFVIDGNGVLRQITINDLPVGRSVDETLRLIQAFQHTDKYGEVPDLFLICIPERPLVCIWRKTPAFVRKQQ